MAKETSTKSDKTNIRRIKANDDAPKKTVKTTAEPVATKTVAKKTKPTKEAKKVSKKSVKKTKVVRDINQPTKNPLIALGNYLRGAWRELKQVRWPTRGATWSMTLAVLLFSAIFVVLILLLDYGFNQLFERILK